jgi:hypothetical protein
MATQTNHCRIRAIRVIRGSVSGSALVPTAPFLSTNPRFIKNGKKFAGLPSEFVGKCRVNSVALGDISFHAVRSPCMFVGCLKWTPKIGR